MDHESKLFQLIKIFKSQIAVYRSSTCVASLFSCMLFAAKDWIFQPLVISLACMQQLRRRCGRRHNDMPDAKSSDTAAVSGSAWDILGRKHDETILTFAPAGLERPSLVPGQPSERPNGEGTRRCREGAACDGFGTGLHVEM